MRCDWCKKRRKTEKTELHIVMLQQTQRGARSRNLWARNWNLCFTCGKACENELDNWVDNMLNDYGPDDRPE